MAGSGRGWVVQHPKQDCDIWTSSVSIQRTLENLGNAGERLFRYSPNPSLTGRQLEAERHDRFSLGWGELHHR